MNFTSDFYKQFNEKFVQRLQETPQQLKQLIDKDFPEEEEAIDHWGSDHFADFLMNNESQMLELINQDYEDSERFGEDDEELEVLSSEELDNKSVETLLKSKKDNACFFNDIATLIQQQLQLPAPQYISTSSGKPVSEIPDTTSEDFNLFKDAENFFNMDYVLASFWQLENKIAFVRYAYSFGDGDFQIDLTLGVVKANASTETISTTGVVTTFEKSGGCIGDDYGIEFTIEFKDENGKTVLSKTEEYILGKFVNQLHEGMDVDIQYESGKPRVIKLLNTFDGKSICRP